MAWFISVITTILNEVLPRNQAKQWLCSKTKMVGVFLTWRMDIIAVSNNEAQQRLTDASTNWLQKLQRSIPEAVWKNDQYLAKEDTDHITNNVCPQYFKSKSEDVTGQERGKNIDLQPWNDAMTCIFSLKLKVVMHTHLYWLAAKDTDEDPSGRGAITPRLRALSDIKAKLKTEMCKSRRLGSAKTDTGYYNYWKDLRPLVNKQATIAFWNTSTLKFYKSVMWWGTALVQFLIKNCPICPCTDSALHILSGCQHTKMRNMII